jgi:upstream activation factor subunit UAF30
MTTKTTKANKKATTPKATVTPIETPVVEAPPPPTTTTLVTDAPLDTTADVESMKARFERLIKAKQDLVLELKKEIQELKKMQRDHEIEIKEASKKSKKKKVPSDDATPRKPSGFAAPVIVSDELYSFLEQFGVKRGNPIARTEVTKHITSYIKDNDLQNPEHRREIVPDATLSKILGPAQELKDPNDAKSPMIITYLKLQKYLSHHFVKKN